MKSWKYTYPAIGVSRGDIAELLRAGLHVWMGRLCRRSHYEYDTKKGGGDICRVKRFTLIGEKER